LDRYFPISSNKRKALRDQYGFAEHDKVIVFVGHFSSEKRPMLLYRAWVKLCDQNICAKLIFIGHTKKHFEVDEGIVEIIKLDALQRGILPLIHFVEETPHVDEYMKIADVFVLPSIREGLPNVLLEAMACALPCVVSDLPGVTDWLVDDGKAGVLFDSDDPDVLAEKIKPYVVERVAEREIGSARRQFMTSNFSCISVAQKVFELYGRVAR
jgi:glycosyltransferase involved in cell wall biosynthesis